MIVLEGVDSLQLLLSQGLVLLVLLSGHRTVLLLLNKRGRGLQKCLAWHRRMFQIRSFLRSRHRLQGLLLLLQSCLFEGLRLLPLCNLALSLPIRFLPLSRSLFSFSRQLREPRPFFCCLDCMRNFTFSAQYPLQRLCIRLSFCNGQHLRSHLRYILHQRLQPLFNPLLENVMV